METKNKIIIDNKSYNFHPVYNLYAGSEDGFIINCVKQKPYNGSICNSGYLNVTVRKYGESKSKTYRVHRFIWECYKGIIDNSKVIDHINNNKVDNRLCNLEMVTQQENCKKSAKNRDYSFVKNNHCNRKFIKAINLNKDNEETYFNSLYAIHQHLLINPGIVKMVCEGTNNCKSGISKIDGFRYRFEYVDELPENYKKSANIKPKRKKDN